ncbi:hypothetical protein SAMN06295912_101301 [Sphingomonas laterariae]|uniref:TraB/GumN family protein n=1 Tax=Edaphosphingomonas laterariae TaxID=861865 RepID=A0A239BPT8_9SPHN|nr:DUF5694 domain-containing protein [Sphingomonas laterariae]SNS09371.1 hypothetical protein SAMN06295912_101301 [Sphingomonas laterariae]
MRMLALVAALIGFTMPASAAEPVQVMVLGVYHFANPGLDLHNARADDPLTPRRQSELAAVTRALLAFRPTHVMVEARPATADLSVPAYRDFTPDMLARDRNEIVQIGYRLAHAAGLRAVQGIDEQPGEGEPDYFPYDKVQAYAASHGGQGTLDALNAAVGAEVKAFEKKQESASIAELLMWHNDPAAPLAGQAFYYGVLGIGDTEAQPGADLNAGWYLRNAKIFAKLMTVARPGDRVVVIYGAGHNYWLRHFARETPGFVSVDPLPYLKAAAGR